MLLLLILYKVLLKVVCSFGNTGVHVCVCIYIYPHTPHCSRCGETEWAVQRSLHGLRSLQWFGSSCRTFQTDSGTGSPASADTISSA